MKLCFSFLIFSTVNAHYTCTQTGQVDTTTENLLKIKPKKASKIEQMNYENSPQQMSLRTQCCNRCGERGANPPGKLNVRTGPHLAYILVPFGFQYFLRFFEWLSDLISFLNFYECWLVGPSAMFPPFVQTSSYTTGCTQYSLRSQSATLTIKTYPHNPA